MRKGKLRRFRQGRGAAVPQIHREKKLLRSRRHSAVGADHGHEHMEPLFIRIKRSNAYGEPLSEHKLRVKLQMALQNYEANLLNPSEGFAHPQLSFYENIESSIEGDSIPAYIHVAIVVDPPVLYAKLPEKKTSGVIFR